MAQWDIFLSHASEDKADVATPLAEKLRALGLTVWLDDDALELGDPLSQTIDEALANSAFGVVILSPHYFAKSWTQKELAALVSLEKVGRKVVLPVLHRITLSEVVRESPLLAANKTVSTSSGLENVAQQIRRAVRREASKDSPEVAAPAPEWSPPPKSRQLRSYLWLLVAAAILSLLGVAGWMGHVQFFGQELQLIHPKPPPSYAGNSESAVVVAPNPVTGHPPVLEAAVHPQATPAQSGYERALKMPGVEPVEGKQGEQGSGSLKRVLDFGDGQELTLLWIEPGEFLMGSPTTEFAHHEDEPLHEVILTKEFFLGETEVTQGQWKAVMGTEPWKGNKYVQVGADVPASNLTYDDALEFCKRLNGIQYTGMRPYEGWSFGLPSEAQWEYACRAGTATAYCSGEGPQSLARVAVCSLKRDGEHSHSVRTRSPNDWGFFDMHGNVWEWAADSWSEGKEFRDGETDPLVEGPTSSLRILRGGSWRDDTVNCRSARRVSSAPSSRAFFVGFRLCLLPGPGAPPEEK